MKSRLLRRKGLAPRTRTFAEAAKLLAVSELSFRGW
jgi:hypothetical protein